MANEKSVLTFDESVKEEILDLFDKSVDSEGFIVEKNNPQQRVLSKDGQEVNIKEFGGIKKDKLKALINIEFNAPIINVTKNSDNSSVDKEYLFDERSGKLEIFIDNLTKEKQKKLKLVLKENFEESNLFAEVAIPLENLLKKDNVDFTFKATINIKP